MSVMKRQLLKVKKQFADQNFLRGEKSEGQSDLDIAQRRVDAIKHSCQTLQKKVSACLQGSGQDANSVEKRKKKMPAFLLANSMQDGASVCEEGSVMGVVLNNCGVTQNQLAEDLLNFEIQVEKNVLSPLNQLLEVDIPSIVKMKKQLNKLTADMDSAKTKYETAVKHCQQTSGSSTGPALAKAETFKEEFEELTTKVEQQRDTLAAEMFSLLSKEAEYAHIFVQWYHLQHDYHSRVTNVLEQAIPNMMSLIMDHTHRPAYGCPLEEHLRVTNRQISYVLEKCISALLAFGMNEEGLFRIAGSASKLKKLKNSFDAGIVNMSDYATDPHSIAGALKSYLRQLPEPLLTHALYDDWMNANKITEHNLRLQNLWQVVNRLPEPNFYNLRYIIKFLAKLTENSETNKMSAQNVAIVMAPNIIWPPMEDQSNHIGMNMTVANIHSSIVDSLVSYADYFFPGDVDFTISPSPLPLENIIFPSDAHMGIVNSGFVASNGEVGNTSPTSSNSPRVIHRPGKKPAPPAPQIAQSVENKKVFNRPNNNREEFPGVTLRSSSRERSRAPSLERTKSVQEPEYATIHRDRLCVVERDKNLSRSATLDRPGKPRRTSLTQRQSHDNLSNLVVEKSSINQEKPVPMVRNSSLERSSQHKIIMDKKPKTSVETNSQKQSTVDRSSGGKPDIPAKPPSLDNILATYNTAGRKSVDVEDIEISISRRSSDKDSIHYADESDNEEVFKIESVSTPMSVSLDSAKESPEDRKFQREYNVDPMMSSFTAKMEKKWAFLTNNQPPVKPPERPPRNFVPNSLNDEYISAPIPGSFVHVSHFGDEEQTNLMTASTQSLPGSNPRLDGSFTAKRTGSSDALLDETVENKSQNLSKKPHGVHGIEIGSSDNLLEDSLAQNLSKRPHVVHGNEIGSSDNLLEDPLAQNLLKNSFQGVQANPRLEAGFQGKHIGSSDTMLDVTSAQNLLRNSFQGVHGNPRLETGAFHGKRIGSSDNLLDEASKASDLSKSHGDPVNSKVPAEITSSTQNLIHQNLNLSQVDGKNCGLIPNPNSLTLGASQNGRVPPSPTGTLRNRPPRPQPPPPPTKPKLNNSSEDTRL